MPESQVIKLLLVLSKFNFLKLVMQRLPTKSLIGTLGEMSVQKRS